MTSDVVTWRQFFVIVCVCWISGLTIGTTIYVVTEPSFPWSYLPLALPMGGAIALVVACVAAPLASILVLEARRHTSVLRSTKAWCVAGCVSGALLGALHPLALLAAALAGVTGDPIAPVLRSSVLFLGVPGGLSGLIIGFVEGRNQFATARATAVAPPIGMIGASTGHDQR